MAGSDDTANGRKSKTMQAVAYFEANRDNGVTINAAAVKFMVSASAVYRRLTAISAEKNGVCPLCGQPTISHQLSQKERSDET